MGRVENLGKYYFHRWKKKRIQGCVGRLFNAFFKIKHRTKTIRSFHEKLIPEENVLKRLCLRAFVYGIRIWF